MVSHIVLLAPRPDLTAAQLEEFIVAFERAAGEIPSVRGVRVGRRVRHGQLYEAAMTTDFPVVAIFEFDDLAALQAYLRHPAHAGLAAQFYGSLAAGLAYDYEMGDAASVRRWFGSPPGGSDGPAEERSG